MIVSGSQQKICLHPQLFQCNGSICSVCPSSNTRRCCSIESENISTSTSSASPGNLMDVSPTSTGLSLSQMLNPSCANCRRRKVKCDKKSPCSHCIRQNKICEFAPRKRIPRRLKTVIGSKPAERESELLKRLNKLEGKE
jgi:hypothetical protein